MLVFHGLLLWENGARKIFFIVDKNRANVFENQNSFFRIHEDLNHHRWPFKAWKKDSKGRNRVFMPERTIVCCTKDMYLVNGPNDFNIYDLQTSSHKPNSEGPIPRKCVRKRLEFLVNKHRKLSCPAKQKQIP